MAMSGARLACCRLLIQDSEVCILMMQPTKKTITSTIPKSTCTIGGKSKMEVSVWFAEGVGDVSGVGGMNVIPFFCGVGFNFPQGSRNEVHFGNENEHRYPPEESKPVNVSQCLLLLWLINTRATRYGCASSLADPHNTMGLSGALGWVQTE